MIEEAIGGEGAYDVCSFFLRSLVWKCGDLFGLGQLLAFNFGKCKSHLPFIFTTPSQSFV
jgi:hypothetical protein